MELTRQLALHHEYEWLILNAMDELATSTPFKDIGIQVICKTAHISKPTFYRYFSNKESAVQWHIDQVARLSLNGIGRTYSCREGIYLMLLGVLEFKDLYISLGKGEKDNPCISEDFTNVSLKRILSRTLLERGMAINEPELQFQILACHDVFHGAFERWRLSGMEMPPEELAQLCADAIPARLRVLLDEPQQDAETRV